MFLRVPARDPGGDRPHGGETSFGGVIRRNLRPDPVRRRRVRAHGHSGAQHAVLHDERFVQGVSSLRLSGRLGRIFRRYRKRGRISQRSRIVVLLAPLKQCEIGRAHVNSSHLVISYAVFCLKKKKKQNTLFYPSKKKKKKQNNPNKTT